MRNTTRKSELLLIIGFLAVIAVVPIGQTCIELARHERVQFTDIFRYQATAKNLRLFENTLAEKSWFQQKLRPETQRFLFATLRDTGSKGVLGRDQWLFYRPDLRYLVEPDRNEADHCDSKWVQPAEARTHRESVEKAIVRFRDQLQERGIALVVLPVPGKPSVYPDQVSRREEGRQGRFRSPTRQLIEALERQNVPCVDLFDTFSAARSSSGKGQTNPPLYLAQDTHWTPQGAQLAARTVAARLRGLNLAPSAGKEFRVQKVAVRRWGDVLGMTQIPGLRGVFPWEEVECEQVLGSVHGPLLPTPSDRPGTYRYPAQKASVLILGDSFCRIYQYAEPQSLGELALATADGRKEDPGAKRLLPGSSGLISHLALALRSPVDAIVSDGGASTDVRRRLSTNPEILEGKQVVVWEFVERDIALGSQGWEDVPLPSKLD